MELISQTSMPLKHIFKNIDHISKVLGKPKEQGITLSRSNDPFTFPDSGKIYALKIALRLQIIQKMGKAADMFLGLDLPAINDFLAQFMSLRNNSDDLY